MKCRCKGLSNITTHVTGTPFNFNYLSDFKTYVLPIKVTGGAEFAASLTDFVFVKNFLIK